MPQRKKGNTRTIRYSSRFVRIDCHPRKWGICGTILLPRALNLWTAPYVLSMSSSVPTSTWWIADPLLRERNGPTGLSCVDTTRADRGNCRAKLLRVGALLIGRKARGVFDVPSGARSARRTRRRRRRRWRGRRGRRR